MTFDDKKKMLQQFDHTIQTPIQTPRCKKRKHDEECTISATSTVEPNTGCTAIPVKPSITTKVKTKVKANKVKANKCNFQGKCKFLSSL